MLIKRTIQSVIENHLFKKRSVVVYGPRRVGKTTLARQIQQKFPDSRYFNCDEPDIRDALTNKTSTELVNFLGKRKLIVLDEAQRVKNIGLTIKLLVDTFPEIQIIATGSSSFDLSNKISEPMTGRVFEFFVTPPSLVEISQDPLETTRSLETRMIFGSYPEIVTNQTTAQETIRLIYQNYLYKDVLEYQNLKNPEFINKLLQALALQIGNEVHFTELAKLLQIDKVTVEKYIRLLELAFVIFRLPPFSRNLRKEINKSRKIYFWDTGIRNAIINNFNPLSIRNDTGSLWENFLISERLKRNNNKGLSPNIYFWRTYDQQEVDFVEDIDGNLHGFEIKWQKARKKAPKAWSETYPAATFQSITKHNYLDFLT